MNESNLMAIRCKGCGKLYVPPRYGCSECGADRFEDISLSGKGEVSTYTTIRIPPLGFEDQAPYDIAVVRLKEGLKLTARLMDYDQKDLNIGAKVMFVKNEADIHWFRLVN